MKILRSHWYYWYTGSKRVAVISMILTALLVGVGMLITTGLSVWSVVIAVLLDTVGFWLILIYAIALRDYLPDMLLEDADTLVLNQFVIPVIAAFVVGRLMAFTVATAYRCNKGDAKS